jgi:hypothetical protein
MIGSNLLDGYGLQLTSTTIGPNQALDVFVEGFNTSSVNKDGYLIVDLSNNLLGPDGYLQVSAVNQPNMDLFAEDSAHTSGDIGSFVLGVRNDLDTLLTNNNFDYSAFAVDAYGHLKIDLYDGYANKIGSTGNSLNINLIKEPYLGL